MNRRRSMDIDKVRKEVENRMRKGESFSLNEIRKIMKDTGCSYRQVMAGFKRLKKEMDEEQRKAEEAGVEFDRTAYISQRMKG